MGESRTRRHNLYLSSAAWLSLAALIVSFAIASGRSQRAVAVNGTPVTTVSAASYDATAIAAEAIVAAFGTNLATTTQVAATAPLPTQLGGTTVIVNGRRAGLFFVSPSQINYLMPAETEVGTAQVVVTSGNGTVSTGIAQVQALAPAVFTANGNGQGVPAALLLRVRTDGVQSYEPLAQYDALLGRFISRPINLGPAGERVFLILYLSGLRRAPDPNNDGNLNETVRLNVAGTEIVPAYAGRQPDYAGLDQINAELPRSLIGRGIVDVRVSVGADVSNIVQVEAAAAAVSGRPPRAMTILSIRMKMWPNGQLCGELPGDRQRLAGSDAAAHQG